MLPIPLLLSNPATKYLAIILLFVLLIAGTYIKGRTDGTDLVEARVASERQKWELKVAVAQSDVNNRIEEITSKYIEKENAFQAEIDKLKNRKPGVITKTVEIFIPSASNVNVPIGFVELHNTAVDGLPLPNKVGANAGAPSNKKLTDVAATVATNYYQCLDNSARLESLQNVVAEFQKKQKELIK